MYESEAIRLQREADNFTKKFEHEKKRLMMLEDQYKQACDELAEKKKQIKLNGTFKVPAYNSRGYNYKEKQPSDQQYMEERVRPPTAERKQDLHNIKTLENKLDKSLVKFNRVQAENRTFRKQIDVMRKEMKNQVRVNAGYNKEINKANDKAKNLNRTTYQGQRVSEETNNQILALKAKHEAEKFNFERKIKDLQDKLKERDDSEMEKTKTKVTGAVAVEASATAGGEFLNPTALLKLRLQKWTNNNKEKKNLMDMYIRNVNIIEDAFAQIKQQTGISSTEEIVTTFIKAEEQNYSLYNYVNMLNSEIDMIEEQNKNIEAEIQRHEELGDMTEKEKEVVRQKIKVQIEEMDAQMKEKDNQIKNIEQQMITIKTSVFKMCEHFK